MTIPSVASVATVAASYRACSIRTPRTLLALLAAGALLMLGACATPTPPPRDAGRAGVDAIVDSVTDSVFGQADAALGMFGRLRAGSSPVQVAFDPPLDTGGGLRTALTARVERRATARATAAHPHFAVRPLAGVDPAGTTHVLVAAVARDRPTTTGGPPAAAFTLNMALVERATGTVVAQAHGGFAADATVDTTPGRFDQDSPVIVDDTVVRGLARTAAATPGTPADAAWLQALGAAPLLARAVEQYDGAQYDAALSAFTQAAQASPARQLRALNGIYLANWRLGRRAEAEQAFGEIVAFGIAQRSLGVKFLFAPGATTFWPDPAVTDMYDAWLRQIARRVDTAGSCLEVLGHSSRTGTEAFNDTLSGQRADTIAQRLASEAAPLSGRSRTLGMGFRENLVGTGTDDVRDALDRRVAFRFSDCAAR